MLGRGRTGSGKTLAFGLAMITRLADGTRPESKRPRSLILVPTRELAMQVSDALEPFVHVTGLRHKLVAGGLSYEPQIKALNKGIDILVATPGRLADLMDRGAVELGGVQIAVLDEADHMADMGFLPEVTAILDEIPAGGQRLLFSATLDKGIDTLVDRYLVDPVTHSTDEAQASVTTMSHHVLLIDPQDKKALTAELAGRGGRVIVFARTQLGTDRIAGELRERGVFAASLHGGLSQAVRNRVLGAFRDGSMNVLVATDVAARGIHVDDVGMVVQVDPPTDHKDYLHRAGRTARAGEEGAVVMIALPHQKQDGDPHRRGGRRRGADRQGRPGRLRRAGPRWPHAERRARAGCRVAPGARGRQERRSPWRQPPGRSSREPRPRLVRWRTSSSELRAARWQPGQNGRVSQTHTTGQLLVATPQIEEGVFRRSVVLVLHHDDDGAQGLVLNRPIDADVDAVLPGWEEHATRPAKVFQGGPVQLDSALGLVAVPGDSPEPTGVRRLFGAVALVDLDTPPTLVVPEVAGLRIFAGYAGWSPGPARGGDRRRARGSSWAARATTSSPASPTTCGAGCCAASPSRCAGSPGSRATRSLN